MAPPKKKGKKSTTRGSAPHKSGSSIVVPEPALHTSVSSSVVAEPTKPKMIVRAHGLTVCL